MRVAGIANPSSEGRPQSLIIRAPRVRQVPNLTRNSRCGGAGRAGKEGVLRDRLGRGHHDIALVDEVGRLVATNRIGEPVDGFVELTAMLAEAGDTPEDPISVASRHRATFWSRRRQRPDARSTRSTRRDFMPRLIPRGQPPNAPDAITGTANAHECWPSSGQLAPETPAEMICSYGRRFVSVVASCHRACRSGPDFLEWGMAR